MHCWFKCNNIAVIFIARSETDGNWASNVFSRVIVGTWDGQKTFYRKDKGLLNILRMKNSYNNVVHFSTSPCVG